VEILKYLDSKNYWKIIYLSNDSKFLHRYSPVFNCYEDIKNFLEFTITENIHIMCLESLKNSLIKSWIVLSASYNHSVFLSITQDKRLNINKYGNIILNMACQYGILDVVKYVIKKGVDPTLNQNNAFRIACMYNYPFIVKYLLKDERIDPSDYNNEAFHQAVKFNYRWVVQLLLTSGRLKNIKINNKVLHSSGIMNKLEELKNKSGTNMNIVKKIKYFYVGFYKIDFFGKVYTKNKYLGNIFTNDIEKMIQNF
jgi:hypothetical protein